MYTKHFKKGNSYSIRPPHFEANFSSGVFQLNLRRFRLVGKIACIFYSVIINLYLFFCGFWGFWVFINWLFLIWNLVYELCNALIFSFMVFSVAGYFESFRLQWYFLFLILMWCFFILSLIPHGLNFLHRFIRSWIEIEYWTRFKFLLCLFILCNDDWLISRLDWCI